MSELLEVCEQAARKGGAVLNAWFGQVEAREKSPKDLVTEADLASQQAIREVVLGRFPDHDFVGEEGDEKAVTASGGYCWVVDPLDGTTNYVHGIPHFAASVALVQDQKVVAGAVFDPILDECFTADAPEDAKLNGRPIQVSQTRSVQEAVVAASFPANLTAGSEVLRQFNQIAPRCRSIRRTGSAALNLAYVAAGRYDAFWAGDLNAWDAAAGLLLVEKAGGCVMSLDGGNVDVWRPRFVVAGTSELQGELMRLLRTGG